MINTTKSRLVSQQAYVKRVLRERHRPETVAGISQSMQTSTSLIADFIRHAFVMIGIVGLVGMAVGAMTEAKLYHQILNWVSSFFV